MMTALAVGVAMGENGRLVPPASFQQAMGRGSPARARSCSAWRVTPCASPPCAAACRGLETGCAVSAGHGRLPGREASRRGIRRGAHVVWRGGRAGPECGRPPGSGRDGPSARRHGARCGRAGAALGAASAVVASPAGVELPRGGEPGGQHAAVAPVGPARLAAQPRALRADEEAALRAGAPALRLRGSASSNCWTTAHSSIAHERPHGPQRIGGGLRFHPAQPSGDDPIAKRPFSRAGRDPTTSRRGGPRRASSDAASSRPDRRARPACAARPSRRGRGTSTSPARRA